MVPKLYCYFGVDSRKLNKIARNNLKSIGSASMSTIKCSCIAGVKRSTFTDVP